MTTTDDERHCRICLMLMNGGTKISKALFEKCVKDQTPAEHIPHPWTLDHFLNANKTKILATQTGKAKQKILFPTGGASTQVEKWDLYMYCFFLIEICGVQRHVRMDIDQLRKMRNKICHQNEPNTDIDKYNRTVDKLEVVYERLLKEIDDEELTNEVHKILKTTKEDPLSHKETIFAIHKFYKTDLETREILTQQNAEISELSGNFKSLMKQVDEIQKKQDLMFSRGLADSEIENCTETCVELRMKNCAWSTERFVSNVLVGMYKKETGQPSNEQLELSEETRAEMMAAVKDTVATFASKKRAIIDAEEQCVILLIQCYSVSSLLSLFYDCINGELTKEFRQLESAIRHMKGLQEVSLEAVIYKDEFYRTMQRTVLDKSVTKTYGMHLKNLQTQNTCGITDVRLVERLLPDSDVERQSQHAVRLTIKTDPDMKSQLRDSIKSGSFDSSLFRLKEEICKHYDLTNLSIEANLLEEECGLFEDDHRVEDDHSFGDDHRIGDDHTIEDDHRVRDDQSIGDDHIVEESYRVEDDHRVGDIHRLEVDHITEVDHIAEVGHILEEEIDRIFDDVNTIEDKDIVGDRLIVEDKDDLSNNWNESKDEDPLSNESKMHSSSNLRDTTCEQYAEDDETGVSNQNCSIKRNPTSIAATQTKYTTKIDQQTKDEFGGYQCEIGETIFYKQLSELLLSNMNIIEKGSHLLVAAFDFGTTFSGYAFSFRDKPLEIYSNNTWNDESNLSLKTPTCILLDPEEKFHSFGYEAENKYKMLCEEDEHHNWLFFRRFKMLLHKNKRLSRQTTVKDITGKRRMFAIDIFSLSIRYLRDHFFSELQKKYSGIEETDIQYVITIPAIWDDNGKQFMRMAALQADIDNAKLTLALEPEAASICCQRITVDSKGQEFISGLQYILIDIGGGTADITAHQINDNGTLTELYKASGGPWGGINVDNNFLDFLKDLFGEQVMSSFKKKHLEDYWYMLREFETNKRQLKFADCHEQEQTYITIKLPLALRNISKNQNGKVLEELIGSSSFSSDIVCKKDKIRVGVELVRKWFEGPVNDIIRHIEDLLKTPEVRQVTTLIMVGGMAESCYVQEKIRYAFPSKRLIIPKDAGLTVLKGAVIFGHELMSISERVMRYSYGIEMFQRFNCTKHKSSFKVNAEGNSYGDNVFHVFVRAGDIVQVGQEISKISSPINKEFSVFPIYRSVRRDTKYTTESDCEIIGLLTLKHVGQDDFKSKKVKITMIFGNTELIVKAEEINTVEKSSSTFNCLME